jgi:predicted O-methyltransferase YrrM
VSTVLRRRLARTAMRLDPELARAVARARYVREWVEPMAPGASDPSPHVPAGWVGHAGIELHVPEQLDRLARWQASYGPLFRQLRQDPRINTRCLGQPYLHNGTYATPDAEIYAAMIQDHRPANILEIGAGYSTRIARRALDLAGDGGRITVIDPEPRTDVRESADAILLQRLETIEVGRLLLAEPVLVFIDSSHILRAGGDLQHLYTRLVPALPAGTLIHVHDIFLPYDYPLAYQQRLYTEQYVVQALLAHSPRFRVVFATHYMARQQPEPMRHTFDEVVGRDDLYYGSSFWFSVE